MKNNTRLVAGVASAITLLWLLSQNHILPFQDLLSPTFENKKEVVIETEQKQTEVYEGLFPCADCSGLKLNLTIRPNRTYVLQSDYIGKSTQPFLTEGVWTLLRGTPTDPKAEVYYFVGQNRNDKWYLLRLNDHELLMLDQQRNRIDAPFNLSLTRLK
ncbi:MAG: putative lipoprotein NlpE involved in copper resistance [Parcubacteria group bacterium]|nr:putative lipoprotein NlpE involved in copper resistance [Parcubacteria group bacterium]